MRLNGLNKVYARRAARRVTLGPACAWALAAITTAGFSGCSSTSGSGVGGPTNAAVHPVLVNIPLPGGFQLVDDRSVGRTSGPFRVAKCEFTGSGDLLTVNKFYKEYMPTAGFTLKQERFDRGEYEMRFDSSAEECIVRIKPDRFNKTTIVVDIGPVPRGSAEREQRPPVPRP